MAREDDARSFVRSLYQTSVDIIPDTEKGLLTIRLHQMATPSADAVARKLCVTLNETETVFPGTNLRLFYEMVSFSDP